MSLRIFFLLLSAYPLFIWYIYILYNIFHTMICIPAWYTVITISGFFYMRSQILGPTKKPPPPPKKWKICCLVIWSDFGNRIRLRIFQYHLYTCYMVCSKFNFNILISLADVLSALTWQLPAWHSHQSQQLGDSKLLESG